MCGPEDTRRHSVAFGRPRLRLRNIGPSLRHGENQSALTKHRHGTARGSARHPELLDELELTGDGPVRLPVFVSDPLSKDVGELKVGRHGSIWLDHVPKVNDRHRPNSSNYVFVRPRTTLYKQGHARSSRATRAPRKTHQDAPGDHQAVDIPNSHAGQMENTNKGRGTFMSRSKWKLVTENGSPRIDEWGASETERFSGQKIPLLALLAEDPRNGLVRLAPGVYEGPKAP
jgi:hypothetical protein